MAEIFYQTGGNLSALTPQKVVSSYSTLVPGAMEYDDVFTERYIPFTPSEAGDMEGAVVCLMVASIVDTRSVTVKLQQNTGSWVDVAGATCTLLSTSSGLLSSFGQKYSASWVYFKFTTPAAVTTASNTWRIAVSGTNSLSFYLRKNGSDYGHAAVLTATTSYSSGDTIFLNDRQTFVVDQSMTITYLHFGVEVTLQWATSPAASYTLAITTMYIGSCTNVIIGSSGSPIPYAQRAVVSVTNAWYGGNRFLDAAGNFDTKVNIFGEVPTNLKTKLSITANNAQKDIVTTEDMSALWTVGDTVYLYGSAGGLESRTISSMAGTTITLNSNLTYKHYAGWKVVNWTRCSTAGVSWTGQLSPGLIIDYKLKGLLVISGSISGFADPSYAIDTSRYVYSLFEDIYLQSSTFNQTPHATIPTVSLQRIYTNAVGSPPILLKTASTTVATVNDLAIVGISGGGNTLYGVNSTYTDIQIANSGYSNMYYNLNMNITSSVVSDMKIYCVPNTRGLNLVSAVNSTLSDISIDNGNPYHLGLGTIIKTTITNLKLGVNVAAVTKDIIDSAALIQLDLQSPSSFTVLNDRLLSALPGSYIRADTYGGTTNDHRSWWNHGKLSSTGSGLSDATVHTAGGLAIRFEPLSSTDNTIWEFTIPTGNIQNKTMMVGVWYKIASATYYAGTHQMPRLTIDYDNGTVAYVEASQTTDWQFLPLPFTPTTTYGQIIVTISGRTDATTTNAYIYFDDFSTLYPAETPLNTQTLDLWVNALPVTPPLATVLSAQDVWVTPTSTLTGAGTVGKFITKLLTVAKFLGLK